MAVGTKPPQHGSRHIAAATWQSAHSRRNMAVGTKPPQSQSAQSCCNMAVGTQPPQEHQCQSRRKNSRHEAAARWQLAKKNADQPSRHEADETKSRRLKNRSGQKNQLLLLLMLSAMVCLSFLKMSAGHFHWFIVLSQMSA